MTGRRLGAGVLVLAIVTVAILSLAPGGLVPGRNRYDKVLHLLAYAGLMGLGGLVARTVRARVALAAGLLAYSAGLEWAQNGLPQHQASVWDGAANLTGLVLSLAMLAAVDLWGPRAGAQDVRQRWRRR